jgi:electron transport complex protein RnfG
MTGKDIIKITLNLVIIYAVGGLLLAGVYAKTSPIIFIKNKIEKEQALKKMMPEAEKIDKVGDWELWHKHAEYFEAKKGDEVIGYVVETYGKGYSSYINILVSVDTNFIVKKINVLHHAETPGLGDEIETEWFKKQFEGKDLEHLVVIKGETEDKIQAITGATISTRAVTNGVRDGVAMLMKKYTGESEEDSEEVAE